MTPWRTTWTLLGLAAVGLAFILVFERHWQSADPGLQPPERLVAFKAAEVTNITLHLTNQLLLRVERSNSAAPWHLTLPINYPAHPHAVEWILSQFEQLVPPVTITAAELRSSKRTPAEFGLDLPAAKLTLQFQGQRREILFGHKTSVGNQVYLQVQHQPDVFTAPVELFDRLPRAASEWRDPILIDFRSIRPNRFEVRAPGRGFTLVTDPTNRVFVLTRPTPARADPSNVNKFLQSLAEAQVRAFVVDNPAVDLEGYGLQPPEAELAIGVGTNDLVVVEFGKSPTNDAAVVFARRLAHTNIVLVSKSLLQTLLVPHSEMRDHHLMNFAASDVDSVEVVGSETFLVRRQTNATWTVGEAAPRLADNDLMKDWLNDLARLEGRVEADVVTDFKSLYGLDPPLRQYVLRAAVTNAAGAVSNRVVAELHLGWVKTNTTESSELPEVFARRPDEAAVYALRLGDVAKLPYSRWQLDNRRVCNFTTNQVLSLTATYHGTSWKILRGANNVWNFAPGSQGVLRNPQGLEELVYRLGELRAESWIARGDEHRLRLGFREQSDSVVLELKNGDKPQVVKLEFADPESGGRAPNQVPYALISVGGETRIFEFPVPLFFLVVRYLFNPLADAGAAQK